VSGYYPLPMVAAAIENAAEELEYSIRILKQDMTNRSFSEDEKRGFLHRAKMTYIGNIVDAYYSTLGNKHGRQLGESMGYSRGLAAPAERQYRGSYLSDTEYYGSDGSSLWRNRRLQMLGRLRLTLPSGPGHCFPSAMQSYLYGRIAMHHVSSFYPPG
jgi:hypothetical protein